MKRITVAFSTKTVLAACLCLVLLLSAILLPGYAEECPAFTGYITEIEKYGSVVLDISVETFIQAGYALGDIVTVSAGAYTADMPFFDGYYVEKGEYLLRAYPGKENLAVCINYGKFANEAGGRTRRHCADPSERWSSSCSGGLRPCLYQRAVRLRI